MTIEGQIQNALELISSSVDKKFFSRRNEVYLVSGKQGSGEIIDFVYKIYHEGSIKKEYAYLEKLNQLCVPRVLARGTNALALEYIPGKTLLECLEAAEKEGEPFAPYVDEMIRFLERFYAVLPGQIYGDVNLRNFIYTENGVCGVDLEEVCTGDIETDIGKAAAYLFTYDPTATDYKKIASEYLMNIGTGRFGLDRKDVELEMKKELEAMRIRRMKKAFK